MSFWQPFFIGFIIAIIIIIFIVGFLYYLRAFPFQFCSSPPSCTEGQLHSNPLEDPNPVLFVQDNKLFYKRSPKTLGCIPNSENLIIHIENPDKCIFKLEDGRSVTGFSRSFNSPVYEITLQEGNIIVLTEGNCIPSLSQPDSILSGKISTDF